MGSKSKKETGSIMSELSLVAPILFTIAVCVTDFGLFLQSYFRAMHIAREGVKAAVSVPNLESKSGGAAAIFSGTYLALNTQTPVVSRTPATFTTNHNAIHERIRRLLMVENGTKKSLQLVSDNVNITSQCIQDPAVGGTVIVTISGSYDPLLPLDAIFGPGAGLRFSARAEGNYLFADCS